MFFPFLLAAAAAVAPVERSVELPGLSGAPAPIVLQVQLQREHAGRMDEILDAARESLDFYSQSIGPYPAGRLTIVEAPWNGPDASPAPGLVAIHLRWVTAPFVLENETTLVRDIGLQWWRHAVESAAADDRALVEGLNRYLQDRVLERLFDRRFQTPAFSGVTHRYFGGFIPWTLRYVRLTRADAERGEWLGAGGDTVRIALAFHTLERHLGWPTLQRALRAAAQRFSSGKLTRTEFVRTFTDTTGRDLTWFFDAALDSRGRLDYAIGDLSSLREDGSNCPQSPCYKTTVVARRLGDRLFTGTGRAPVGEYESGRALPVQVTFSDGQRTSDFWDGRAASKTFTYFSPARAASAEIDPGQTLLLDADVRNNSRTLDAGTSGAASNWAAKWMVWLQDLLLTYAFFA